MPSPTTGPGRGGAFYTRPAFIAMAVMLVVGVVLLIVGLVVLSGVVPG